jgi:hypothetical protein
MGLLTAKTWSEQQRQHERDRRRKGKAAKDRAWRRTKTFRAGKKLGLWS